ncbi:MAG TPA: SulP family inorganic anion transporter [Candidatus Tyrphobacter sp.]
MLFASFRGYRPEWIAADLLAGTLLAAIAIPEQIATARLAGMPPETGLYAFVVATLAFAVLGVNRFLSVGADSTIAPIFAVTIAGFATAGSHDYVLFVGFVALLVGAMLVVAGALRAGWISDLLSIPVTVGFLAGIAVQIVVAQLPPLLGITVTHRAVLPRIVEIAHALPHANALAFALGAGVLAVILAAKRVSPKIPGAVIALAGAGVAVGALHLAKYVPVIGALHPALPRISIPLTGTSRLGDVLPLSVVVAVVCTLQTVTTLRTFRSAKGLVDPSRDLTAVGIGSIAAGLVGAFAVDASPPRTAVVESAGGRSQIGGLIAVLATVLLLLLGARLTSYVAESALAGLLIFIATQIFRFDEMRRIARENRPEMALVVLAAALVVALPINVGVMLSILLSLFYGVYVMLRPPSTELVHVPQTTIWWPPTKGEKGERRPGTVVFSPAAPLYFMNVRYIAERLAAAVAGAHEKIELVIVECSGVIDIDYTGAHVFKSVLRSLRARGITVGLARLSDDRARAAAARTGLIAEIGEDHVFKSADEAIQVLSQG